MKIQRNNGAAVEYNVITQSTFSLNNVKNMLRPDQKPYYDDCKRAGMDEKKAI